MTDDFHLQFVREDKECPKTCFDMQTRIDEDEGLVGFTIDISSQVAIVNVIRKTERDYSCKHKHKVILSRDMKTSVYRIDFHLVIFKGNSFLITQKEKYEQVYVRIEELFGLDMVNNPHIS